MFSVKGLVAGYGPAQVLHGINLTVNHAEAVAVLGPNGAGKTTLLRSVFRGCTVTAGEIVMNGTDLLKIAEHKVTSHGVGHVPEGRGLFPEMTVVENLVIGGLPLRSRARSRKRIEEIIEIFPLLGQRRSQVVATMSGGEQQMVAIGRALMPEPKLLMLDEPSLGLAPMIVSDIFERLTALTRSASEMALLVVEQRVQEALQLCDRAYVIEGGSVIAEGPAEELSANELLVEAFFGRGQQGRSAGAVDHLNRAGSHNE